MAYIEIDLDDELFEKVQELAEEEGLSVEDVIIDIIKDEIEIDEEEVFDDYDNEEDIEYNN
ncbi:MAG: ribbon-helix-helix protein, CopG family [Patescibacteria group bacterium]